MKGMDICKEYFMEVCYPILRQNFSEQLPRMAAGLIGEGSECYGYDDALSRDHDFGPGFQIFIPKEDFSIYGQRLQSTLEQLPRSFRDIPPRNTSQFGDGRIGLFAIEEFYQKYLSVPGVPDRLAIWRQIPEYALSTATNGEVFFDNLGRFTQIREELKKGYPQDIKLKKMAARLLKIAQSGQYNFPRCIKRQEYVAALLALDQFISAVMSYLYLLNDSYCPYYKWAHRGLFALPVMGKDMGDKLSRLVLLSPEKDSNEMIWLIEEICIAIFEDLKQRGWAQGNDAFLLDHGMHLVSNIKDPGLKGSNPWIE